jgi:hypothetical protein
MKTLNRFFVLISLVPMLTWQSCKVESVANVTETTKSIAGNWKIIKVTRDGTDITNYWGLDFTKFMITFTNNAYTITNPLPFIVSQNGAYSLNDPKVPTQITFTATGGSPITTDFVFPIVTGVRNISLQFSANPGCNDNTYVYTLAQSN